MAFNSLGIINQHISEADLKTYYVGFDLGVFRYNALTELLMDAIVDFAFGYHTGILKQYDRRILKEAATSIYKIKEYSEVKWTYVEDDSELFDCELAAEQKYLKKGEFGELILHILLRDFIGTIPLLSKIYFKDTDNATVHGFDSVHIGPHIFEPDKESIYLGESKIYSRKDGTAGKHGIEDLIEDIKSHFKKDFLYRESALISKKKYSFIPIEEYSDANTKDEYQKFIEKKKQWFDFFDSVAQNKTKLQDLLNSVTIPMVCTYQSKLFEQFSNEQAPNFIAEYEKEMRSLKDIFDTKLNGIEDEIGEPIRTDLNIILLLFPIPSKKELIKLLHQKLYSQQNA